jgi:diguanylate cyclase (GGDEF)-like protein
MQTTTAILEAVGVAAEYLSSASWEANIHAVLARLAAATDVSRVYIFQNHTDDKGALLTSQRYEWVRPGVSSQVGNEQLQNVHYRKGGFVRWLQTLSQGKPIYGVVEGYPDSERPLLEAQEILSMIVVPIFVGTEWWGFIGFDDRVTRRQWNSAEVEAIKAAANIFGSAIQRRRMVELEERLVRLATFDDLTGLPNRRALKDFMEREHARAVRRQRPYCVALLDLDRFKLINDTFGHAMGDNALAALASTLKDSLRTGDWVGRWGGEEFVCFLPETGVDQAGQVMERLRDRVEFTPVPVDGEAIELSVSIGLAAHEQAGETLEAVLAKADTALYQAKRDGRNRIVHAEGLTPATTSLASLVQAALRDGRISPAYQAIVSLASGETVAEETLARIITETGEVLPAAQFVPAASQLQLLHRIDHTLIRQSVDRCARRILAGDVRDLFVNVSADLLRHPRLVEDILSCAEQQCVAREEPVAGTKPLVIQITECELMGDARRLRESLAPFLESGLRLALGDFGGGYSSFNHLAHLPVAFLKVGAELVALAQGELRARTIIGHIQKIAQDLGLTTIADGVQDETTADILRDLGVDWAQGVWFGSPALQ